MERQWLCGSCGTCTLYSEKQPTSQCTACGNQWWLDIFMLVARIYRQLMIPHPGRVL